MLFCNAMKIRIMQTTASFILEHIGVKLMDMDVSLAWIFPCNQPFCIVHGCTIGETNPILCMKLARPTKHA